MKRRSHQGIFSAVQRLLLLFFCWLITSISSAQIPSTAFPDMPTITENSVGKAQAGMTVPQLKHVYQGCSFEERSMKGYGQKGDVKQTVGICVKFKGQELFVAHIFEGKIWTLIVLNSRYKTAKGVHIGSTATELKEALPTAKVVKTTDKNIQLAELVNEHGESISYYFKDQTEDVGNYQLIPKSNNSFPVGSVYAGVPIQAAAAKITWIRVDDPDKLL